MPNGLGTITNELIKKVATIAPVLGTALGTPALGMGLSLIAKAFNLTESDPASIMAAINADPEAFVKIKQIEQDHFAVLQQYNATNYQTEVDDRKSAREREVSLRDYVPTILAIGFLINYALIQFYCVTHPNAEIDVISARFQDVLIMIMSYYFGSSHKGKVDGS